MRFHTFNKRIIIYDVPRNFIGDTYWHEDEAVQDGDELQLEKGILVQVGEAVGSIEQDLTALFEKKKQRQAASPGKTTTPPRPTLLASARSTAILLSQLRPKSLNALLGTPRGPHGRALVSTKSPYEHRQRGQNDGLEDGRAFKRQRLNSCPNRNTDTPLWVRTADSQGSPQDQQEQKSRVPTADKSTKETVREIIEVDSSDEDIAASQNVRPKNSSRVSDRQNQRKSSPDASSLFLFQTPDNSSSAGETARPGVVAEPPEYLSTIDTQAAPAPSATDHAVVNPLRIVSRKPRKKLMYKDLLPQRPPSRDNTENRGRKAPDDGSKDPDSLVSERPALAKDIGKLLDVEKTSKEARSRKGKQQAKQDPPESSQAFSESDCGIDTSTSEVPLPAPKLAGKRAHRSPNTSINVGAMGAGPHVVTQSKSPNGRSKTPPYSLTNASARASHATNSTWNTGLKLSELDKILLARPEPTGICASSDSKARGPQVFETNTNPKDPPSSFQTVPEPINPQLNNSDLPPPEIQALHNKSALVAQPQLMLHAQRHRVPPRPTPPLCSRPRSPLRKSLSESDKVRPLTANKPPPLKRSLQKATSDMISFHSNARDAAGPVEDGRMLEDKDLGPWSREAFDLFGWIPEGNGKG